MKRFAFSYVDAKFNYVRFFRNWMITVPWNVPMGCKKLIRLDKEKK